MQEVQKKNFIIIVDDLLQQSMFIVYAAGCKAYDESHDYRSVARFKALKM